MIGMRSFVCLISLLTWLHNPDIWRIEMTAHSNVTHRDPDILSGTPVFMGARVSVRSLFDYLEGDDTLEEFLHRFPSITREQAIAVLDAVCEFVKADAHTV